MSSSMKIIYLIDAAQQQKYRVFVCAYHSGGAGVQYFLVEEEGELVERG